MATNDLLIQIRGDIKDLKASIQKSKSQIKSLDKTTKTSTQNMTKSFNGFSSGLKSIVGAGTILLVGKQLIDIGKAAISAASDLNEVQSKTRAVFGEMADDMLEASKAANQLGQSQREFLDNTSLFGTMAISMGATTEAGKNMATTLNNLAVDLTSFHNLQEGMAQTALKAVFTGETEALKNLGVVMTQANLQAFALSKGYKGKIKDLSELAKVQLRYDYVLSRTTQSQGDYSRTSEDMANKTRSVKAQMEDMQALLGQQLMPIWLDLLSSFSDFVTDYGTEIESTFNGIGKAVKGIAWVFKLITIESKNAIKAFKALFTGDFDAEIIDSTTQMLIDEAEKSIKKQEKLASLKGRVDDLKKKYENRTFDGAAEVAQTGRAPVKAVSEIEGQTDLEDFEDVGTIDVADILPPANFQKLTEFQTAFMEMASNMKSEAEVLAGAMMSTFEAIGQVVANSMEQMFAGEFSSDGLKKSIKEMLSTIAKGIIAEGVMNIGVGIAKLLYPLTAEDGAKQLASGGKMVAVGTAGLGAATALATGGVAYGETPAIIGEYPGASSDPEIVTRRSHLNSVIQNTIKDGLNFQSPSIARGVGRGEQKVMVGGELRLDGADAVFMIRNAEHDLNRIS